MSSDLFGLLDLALGFGVIVAICVWQLASTEKAKRQRIEREKARKSADADKP